MKYLKLFNLCLCKRSANHRNLHLLTHSFPTRRSSYLHAQSLDSLTGTPPASEGETKSAQPSLDEQTRRMSEQAATSETRLAELKAQLAQAPKEITEAQREIGRAHV